MMERTINNYFEYIFRKIIFLVLSYQYRKQDHIIKKANKC